MDHGLEHLVSPGNGGDSPGGSWSKLSAKKNQEPKVEPVRRISDTTERFAALDKQLGKVEKTQKELKADVQQMSQKLEHSMRDIKDVLHAMQMNAAQGHVDRGPSPEL